MCVFISYHSLYNVRLFQYYWSSHGTKTFVRLCLPKICQLNGAEDMNPAEGNGQKPYISNKMKLNKI